MIDTETLFVRRPKGLKDLGGYIDDNSDNPRGFEEYRKFIDSGGSFFGKEEYRVFFVKNVSDRVIKNIDVTVSGGKNLVGLPVVFNGIDKLTDSDRIKVVDNISWLDYYILQKEKMSFQDLMRSKFDAPKYPYLGSIVSDIKSIFNDDEELLSTAIAYWNNVNYVSNAYTRSSFFNQVKVSTFPSYKRVPSTIDEKGLGLTLDLGNREEVDSFLPRRVVNELQPGGFWGFYVKMDFNFNYKMGFNQDFSFMEFSWQEQDGTYKSSQLTRFVFETGYDELKANHSSIVKSMYESYPPFFGEYEAD